MVAGYDQLNDTGRRRLVDAREAVVRPALPKGYALADLVASDESWIDQVHKPMATMEIHRLQRDGVVRGDAEDGSILRRLLLPVAVTGQIACKSGGTYRAYATDEKSRLVELTAQ